MKNTIICLFLFFLVGCTGKNFTTVTLHISPLYQGKMFLEQLPYQNEKLQKIDSAIVNYKTTTFQFKIPAGEQRVFRLRIKDSDFGISFINEAAVDIYALKQNGTGFYFVNSPANTILKNFIDQQDSLNKKINAIAEERERQRLSVTKLNKLDSLDQILDSIKMLSYNRSFTFTDTTSNAGAFLMLYKRVNFDTNYQVLKAHIIKASRRFPQHPGIRQLSGEMLQYVSIFEEEYNIGDVLPPLTLPNMYDKEFSTGSLKGKYYLIDVWSTWCNQCYGIIKSKNDAVAKYAGKLEVVSIAMDSEKKAWLQAINQNRIEGIQLIDEKMWKGKAVQALKFDSIPFNFLVSPEGRVLAKAIPTDSLSATLNRLIK